MESKRVTIYDIARATNFSTGTVNRALSGKGRIHPETRQLILDTAREMGYCANDAARGLRRNTIKIGAVLFCPVDEYVDAIVGGIQAAALELKQFNVQVDVHKIPFTTREACCENMVERMQALSQDGYQGVILFASAYRPELAEITRMVDSLAQEGIPTATVALDLPQSRRVLHVGVDGFMAGRMAAELLYLCCPGQPIALLTISADSEVNTQYIRGFMDYGGKGKFSDILVYEHDDEPARVEQVTLQMLREHPDVKGIYMTTASSGKACRAIGASGKQGLKIVTTDLFQDTVELLDAGVVCATLYQNPFLQGKDVVRKLYRHLTNREDGGVHRLVPALALASNARRLLEEER